jgi:hypothetical protein
MGAQGMVGVGVAGWVVVDGVMVEVRVVVALYVALVQVAWAGWGLVVVDGVMVVEVMVAGRQEEVVEGL